MIKVTDADKYETVLVPSEMLRSETKESREPDKSMTVVSYRVIFCRWILFVQYYFKKLLEDAQQRLWKKLITTSSFA
ncbi:hypothetical protein DPMN_141545 [Dreissena polymorpha]|uniref:Uncharacterized protein n=1 Tax=Dreissena polymorpha TaxID=45954 RepID=A0A9D4JIE1_DREPO|nr:hypothetical protein DPMN_141545 [Dreissena polymorpha]